jgi:Mn2+/Fe2+ NRAMP family transporter
VQRAASEQRRSANAPLHGVAHHRRGILRRFMAMRHAGATALAAFLGVLGPGLLAGLSDDDPAGITTYSLLGTEHGYTLLWIIPLSTLLLVQFHLLAVRIGAASGMGFVAAVRARWGIAAGHGAAAGLLAANIGTICAQYAGIAAAASLLGMPAWLAAPLAGAAISATVVFGSFHRVERILLVLAATLCLYLVDGVLAGPDWQAAARGALVPTLPDTPAGWVAIAAALGTTLAPWGLAFIQSYAVDKKIRVADLRWERVEVIAGSLLTGIVGLAIAIACAATLHRAGLHIDDAADAARALEPLAGTFAATLFGAGLLGASLLGAAIVPLATAYSLAEGVAAPASLDLDSHHYSFFYAAFVVLTLVAVLVVSLPGMPLIRLMYLSQVVNAVLLPLHLVALVVLASDRKLMGALADGGRARTLGIASVVLVLACIGALIASELGGVT